MGVCKTTLPWGNGKTLLTYQLEQWLVAGFTPVVVLGYHNADRQKRFLLMVVIAVINADAATG
ncbi:MAG: nucleotidyltransferase family protein, partial [Calothrix sp. SM1_7_51]|nr:nucleotidyltransferase family protein [Calothrix sp. SM1_7_51]